MAIIKCKMCGGDMEISADKTFGVCEYCGSTMTLPKVDSEQRAAIFNRGNHFRRICEFDKALAVYERIVAEDDTDAEAHWCCALCRFGIEYVEDPATMEWLPTCHRASFDSFLEDVDYLAAVEHSDGMTRRQYQKDAAKIAEVQRGILATSQTADPFDVFICYKETDEQGQRTRDSMLAQDIYYQLTEEGYRVFFSRITLEDVAGTQYEPYIFAALNSAKVMVAVGTKAEHLNAVWVKNEWSRFLALMKKDRSKLLLPCYRDMDPYDLPEQLGVLQSYDMGKIGFIQDLIRGIKKIVAMDEPKATVIKETVVAGGNANTGALLKRAFIFLEDGDWKSADEYCEKVLDIDPECAQAYLGKLMAEMRVRKQESLKDQAEPFDNKNNYQKAIRFGDDKVKGILTGCTEHINSRNENARLESIYNNAKSAMNQASVDTYIEAANLFQSIRDYLNSAALAEECASKAEALQIEGKYQEAITLLETAISEQEHLDAVERMESLGDYKDALELKRKFEDAWQAREERAMEIWKEYRAVKEKELAIAGEIEKKTALIITLKTDINKTDDLLKKVKRASEQIASLENLLKTAQCQIAEQNDELSRLGVFAFFEKKRLSEKVNELTALSTEYSNKIAWAKEFIDSTGSEESILLSRTDSKRKIDEHNKTIDSLNAELALLEPKLVPIVEKLDDRQIIAVLAQNEECLPLLVREYLVVMRIKADYDLREMIKSMASFYLLPKETRKSVFGQKNQENELDVEAMYYQACEAMKTARSIADIEWARNSFLTIGRYKDSDKRLQKCAEIIAKGQI